MGDEVEEETMERVYDSDQDEYFLTPKTKTKTESSDKTMKVVYDPDKDDHILNTKDNNGPKAVVPCWACGKTFKNDRALKTHE